MPPSPRAAAWIVTAAFLFGVLLRLMFGLGYWVDQPLTHDEREYLALARSLASGEGFRYPPEMEQQSAQTFGRAPLYPWLLSQIGGSAILDARPVAVPDSVKIAQAILGGLAVPTLAVVAWRIAGPSAGVVAGVITAIHPPLVSSVGYALTEALFVPIAWLGVLLLGQSIDRVTGASRQRTFTTFAAGLITGLAILMRPGALVFLGLAVVWLAIRGPRRLLLPLIAGAMLVVTPWTIRNIQEHGRFVLVASEGGITFWTGNHPLATGEGDMAANPGIAQANRDFRQRYPGLDSEALESMYYREALQQITEHPLWWMGLILRKAFHLVVPIGPSYALHSTTYRVAFIVPYLALLPLALAGVGLLWRSRTPVVALALMGASAIVTALIFFPQDRFRLPVIDPALIVCASIWLVCRSDRSGLRAGLIVGTH